MNRTAPLTDAALFKSATAILASARLASAAATRVQLRGLDLLLGEMGYRNHRNTPSCPESGEGHMASVPWYGIKRKIRMMQRDTIGGLAKAAGVGVETIRYYQRRGLLPEPARPPGEIRRYGETDLKRMKFIRSAQAAGFTLCEIGELIALDASDDRARARELAQA